MKQGEENTKFIKEPDNPTRDYVFQKNGITKTATYIVVGFLIVLIIGIVASIVVFGTPISIQ